MSGHPLNRRQALALLAAGAALSGKALAELIDKELPLMRAIAQRAAITAD